VTTPIRLAIGVYLLVVGTLVGVAIERMRYDVQRSEVLGRYERALHEWQAYRMALEQDGTAPQAAVSLSARHTAGPSTGPTVN
jgi:hypothetical protein